MTAAVVAQLVPAAVAVLLALAALIRAEAAHRKLDDHVDYQHSVVTSTARKLPPGTNGGKV